MNRPVGVEAICQACRILYPNQPNPLQVTAVLKYWLGGPDPLDYINMYVNAGQSEAGVPPHWHYVTFGLSDLHGDGRVHGLNAYDGPSGYGFELTFRLRKEVGENNPPTWPAGLLQSMARYIFNSGKAFRAGDHVTWHAALDGSGGDSRIRHILIEEDPQLRPEIVTPHGTVQFLQVIGLCEDELRAAQKWNGPGLAALLRRHQVTGGPFLVTDMRRGESIFEVEPALQERVTEGVEREGSNLTGVTTQCRWDELPEDDPEIDVVGDSHSDTAGGVNATPAATEHLQPHPIEHGVHIRLSREAGEMLPLAVRGRLRHGRHFTLINAVTDTTITLVPDKVTGSYVNEDTPYVVQGSWLQVYIPDDFVEQLEYQVDCLSYPQELKLPLELKWPERRLAISVLSDDAIDLWEPVALAAQTPSTAAPTAPIALFPLPPNPFML